MSQETVDYLTIETVGDVATSSYGLQLSCSLINGEDTGITIQTLTSILQHET